MLALLGPLPLEARKPPAGFEKIDTTKTIKVGTRSAANQTE